MEEKSIQASQENIAPVQVPSNVSKPNPWKIFSLVIIFLVLSGGFVLAGLYAGRLMNTTPNKPVPMIIPQLTGTNTPSSELTTTANLDNDPQVKFFPKPIKVPNMGLMTTIKNSNLVGEGPGQDPSIFDWEGNSSYYKIGIMKDLNYKDRELYLIEIKNLPQIFGSGTYESFLRFIKDGEKYVFLEKNSTFMFSNDQKKVPANLIIEKSYMINSLKRNPEFLFLYEGKNLIFEGWADFFEPPVEVSKIGMVSGKEFFKEVKSVLDTPTFRQIGKARKFYLKYPDSTYGEYTLNARYISLNPQKYSPINQEGVVKMADVPPEFQITWTDGLTLKEDEKSGAQGVSYDQYNSDMVIPVTGGITYYDKTIGLKNDLVLIGTNPAGEEFFGLKDKNHIIYTDFYKNRNDYSDFTKNMSLEEFVAQRPMFFWKDLFGDYHAMFRGDFEIAAGIAKPAIYLYPEKEMRIRVGIDSSLVNVFTIPEYGGGWNVVAKPDGTIFYNGKDYDYLFYEGNKKGFIFKGERADVVFRDHVVSYLSKKLVSFGLNEKETRQFIEYWEPKMESSAFYEVSFMGTSELQKTVPLYVSPRPETLIRVLMKFTGRKDGTEKIGLFGTPVKRVGFTVVEWGGLK